jgi:hypothetical protein
MNYEHCHTDTIRVAGASTLQVLFIWLFLRYIFPVLRTNIHALVSGFVYFSAYRVIHFIIMESATMDPSSCMSHALGVVHRELADLLCNDYIRRVAVRRKRKQRVSRKDRLNSLILSIA